MITLVFEQPKTVSFLAQITMCNTMEIKSDKHKKHNADLTFHEFIKIHWQNYSLASIKI